MYKNGDTKNHNKWWDIKDYDSDSLSLLQSLRLNSEKQTIWSPVHPPPPD